MRGWIMNSIWYVCSAYLITTSISLIGLGVTWAVTRGVNPRSDIFYYVFALSAVCLFANVMTFVYFYLIATGKYDGVPNALRVLAFAFGQAIFLTWVMFMDSALDNRHRYKLTVSFATAGFILVFAVISTLFMNEQNYVGNPHARSVLIFAYALFYFVCAFICIRLCVDASKVLTDEKIRKYIYVVSATLTSNMIARFVIDSTLFRHSAQMTDAIQAFDPSLLSNLIVSVATLIFATSVDFSPLYKLMNADADTEKKGTEEKIEIAAEKYRLTVREKEVFELLFTGMSYQEIAEALNVSVNTIKRHVHNCYSKLGISNRYDLFLLIDSDNDTNR